MDNMNITSAQYVAGSIAGTTACIKITCDGIEMSVPLDPANRHYAEIMKQVDAGDLVIEDAV